VFAFTSSDVPLANSGFAADGLPSFEVYSFEAVVEYHDFGLVRHHLAMV
jgi:hypothetical protein